MSNEFIVEEAKREKLIGAIALMGPSGAGKTLSALFLAFGIVKARYPELSDEELWKKIGVCDTEHRRSLIYAERLKEGVYIGRFLHVDLKPPFTVNRYSGAIGALKRAGAEVIITDSISHAWEAEGGMLDLQQAKGGNFQAWKHVNPEYRRFLDLITGVEYNVHTINCIRSKQKHEVSQTETGKLKVEKVGLQPVQRDSLEYELQISLALNMEHRFEVSKDNSDIFEGRSGEMLTVEDGQKIYGFLEEGYDILSEQEEERQKLLSAVEALVENSDAVAAQLKQFENHPNVNRPVSLFRLGDLQRAYTRLNDTFQKEQEKEQHDAKMIEAESHGDR